MTKTADKNVPALRFPGFEGEWEKKPTKQVMNRVSDPVEVHESVLYQQIGIRSHGKGIFHKELVTGKSIGNKRVFWVKPGMFIVNIVFAWEQAVAKTTEQESGMIASHRFPMYEPINGVSHLDYILYFFLTNRGKHFLNLASPGGAGRNKTLGQGTFEKLKLNIPSLPEQQKIADFLSAVDRKIQQLTEKKALLEAYKKGVMQQIFKQEIRFRDEDGRAFPDWEEQKLGEIGSYYNGLSGKTKEDFGNGKPFITYTQVFENSKIEIQKFGHVKIIKGENQQKVKYGDIFFTISSETANEVGTCSVLLDHIDELYLNSFCFGYRPDSFTTLSPEFSRFIFRAETFRREVIKLAQGSTRFNLSKVQMMKIKVLLPNEKEQQKIAAFLTHIDQKIAETARQLSQTQAFKKGLLQQMFV